MGAQAGDGHQPAEVSPLILGSMAALHWRAWQQRGGPSGVRRSGFVLSLSSYTCRMAFAFRQSRLGVVVRIGTEA